jgi:hypothetical protein
MHLYEAMSKARELWGDDAIARQSVCVQNDGRLNFQYEVGWWRANGERMYYGGASFEAAFDVYGESNTERMGWISDSDLVDLTIPTRRSR